MDDCSSSIADFCMQLRSFCVRLETSCTTLRASVIHPPSSQPSPNLSSLLTTLSDRVSSTAEAVENLESKTTEVISFQELLGHSMEIYKQNEAGINALEERLKEYGYTPVSDFPANDRSDEPAKSFDLSELSLEAVVPTHLISSNMDGMIAPVNEAKKSLSILSQVKQPLGLCAYGGVNEGGQYGSFYPGTLSLQDLGLSAAGLACLAEGDSSQSIDYNICSTSFGADQALQENAPSSTGSAAEEEHTGTDVPGYDVPFFKPVDEYEYSSCPTWLKMQISFEDLNEIIDKMYGVLANKEAGSHQSALDQEDIVALNAGTKLKPSLLLLVKLGRLRTGHENGATVYHQYLEELIASCYPLLMFEISKSSIGPLWVVDDVAALLSISQGWSDNGLYWGLYPS
ncbi:hypothetical protein GOP47_0030142 [Adiantum capillus-veneris]|nr:hypothetical protein GOP47_0030142 [Adiantum capillus-veneris]